MTFDKLFDFFRRGTKRPRLDVHDPIRHDNPDVSWIAPDQQPPHREPRLNPEDYMEAVEDQKARDQKLDDD